jgi:hypothetical protein
MQERGVLDENKELVRNKFNRPVVELVPSFSEIPVMRTKEVKTIEARPTGKKTMGLRYDQLMLLMLAAG